jgi:carboxymethylenebutenolidase
VAIKTENVVCGDGMPAFIAIPDDGASKHPCVVLLHERYGLVQHSKDLAARFASEGYMCIAPDLFHMHPDQEALHKGDASCEPTDAAVAAQMDAAIEIAVARFSADPDRLAVMGVCQTARYPLVCASRRKIAAALCWYGAAQPREWQQNERFPVALDDLIGKVDCPVLGMFGEKDHIISVDDVCKLRASLEKHRKSYEIEIFAGAPHGWLNDTMPGRYRPQQAEAAWSAQRAFLKRAFSGEKPTVITQKYTAGIAPDYDFSKHVRYE